MRWWLRSYAHSYQFQPPLTAAVLWDVGAVFVVVIVAAVVVVDVEEVVVAAGDAVGIVAAKCFCFQWKVEDGAR